MLPVPRTVFAFENPTVLRCAMTVPFCNLRLNARLPRGKAHSGLSGEIIRMLRKGYAFAFENPTVLRCAMTVSFCNLRLNASLPRGKAHSGLSGEIIRMLRKGYAYDRFPVTSNAPSIFVRLNLRTFFSDRAFTFSNGIRKICLKNRELSTLAA